MPSPSPEHPGLFIRDPYRFSDAMLIIPPALVACLECFDGGHSDLDLRERLVQLTGDLNVGQLQEHLLQTLSSAGFLEDETFARLKQERMREFETSPVREPVHAGSAYPAEPESLEETMVRYLNGASRPAAEAVFGIAAPHVSPEGGWQSYRAAYSLLGPQHRERTFII